MSRRILLCSLVVIALAALSLFVMRTKPQPVQSFRMTNGVVVAFLETTYGSNHTLVLGKSYQRSLYKMLPAALKPWSGATAVKVATQTIPRTNTPAFWLHETFPQPNDPSLPGGHSGGYLPVRVVDEFGCEYDPNGASMGTIYAGREGDISYYQIDTPDPHGKIVGICIYDSDVKTQRLANFLIPGTALVPLPAPTQPLTLPKQDGDLTFQLTSLFAGLKSEPFGYTKMTNGISFSQAIFHITRNGAPVPNWFPENLKVTDAHDKVISIRALSQGFRGGDNVLNFEPALDPAVGPFKLRVDFVHHTGFSPDELVTLKNVPFPTGSESLAPQMEVELPGRQLLVENIYAARAPRPISSVQPSQPVMEARLTPATNSVHLQLIRAVNEAGTEMPCWSTDRTGKGEYYFAFDPGVRASSMTLTFAVHQSRFAEFEATPILVSTNKLSKH
ncbi:MAG: hypothetical protein JWQ04_2654 [Pedosphaera sp.]|nr:hypothetical protein [Pedosphaera sp.]